MIQTKPPFRKPGEDIKSGIGGVANADIQPHRRAITG
jgi:hypothetical protein